MKKVNTNNFKKTLSKFSTGITVVCVKNNNSIYGKTVNSFNSLSLNPPVLVVPGDIGVLESNLDITVYSFLQNTLCLVCLYYHLF